MRLTTVMTHTWALWNPFISRLTECFITMVSVKGIMCDQVSEGVSDKWIMTHHGQQGIVHLQYACTDGTVITAVGEDLVWLPSPSD